ncbi:glycosyltransferase [Candidatus Marinimicrobia bacterium]|nr:glycosyltransferase [Candidatus Neomarinimicrobiota bacterium]
MNQPLTVILPVYNGAKFLNTCIESILQQTYQDFEFLIIDDFSKDKSIEIISSYTDSRINFISNNKNLGLTKTLNNGLKIATGNYIARIDQDDFSNKERFSKQIDYLTRHPNVKLIGSWCNIINGDNKFIKSLKPPKSRKKILESFIKSNPFIHSSVIFDKKTVLKLGGYPESFVHAQDFALWYSITINNLVYNIPEKLVTLKWHSKRATLSSHNKKFIKDESLSIYKQALNNKEISIIYKIKGKILLLFKPWIFREFFGFDAKF